jgi:hypothetical protein
MIDSGNMKNASRYATRFLAGSRNKRRFVFVEGDPTLVRASGLLREIVLQELVE